MIILLFTITTVRIQVGSECKGAKAGIVYSIQLKISSPADLDVL